MKRSRVFLLSACLMLGSLSLAEVTTDFDSEGRFDVYRTYAWAKGTPAADIDQKRIIRAIEMELTARGFEKVKEKPGMFVVTHVATSPDQEIDVNDFGYRRRHGLGTVTISIFSLSVGSLAIDFLDGETKIPVWRGIAPDTVTDKPEKNEKKINKAVAKLFGHYPPADDE